MPAKDEEIQSRLTIFNEIFNGYEALEVCIMWQCDTPTYINPYNTALSLNAQHSWELLFFL